MISNQHNLVKNENADMVAKTLKFLRVFLSGAAVAVAVYGVFFSDVHIANMAFLDDWIAAFAGGIGSSVYMKAAWLV